MPESTKLPTIAEGIVMRTMNDGAVLFNPQTETYFGLNDVGALVWELLSRAESLGALHTAVHLKYPEVDLARIESDVRVLLEDLRSFHLIVGPTAG